MAKVEQFEELGIPVYTTRADCHLKGKKADGDEPPKSSMDLVDREIDEIARIFNVADRGKAIIGEMKAREQAVKARIGADKGIARPGASLARGPRP